MSFSVGKVNNNYLSRLESKSGEEVTSKSFMETLKILNRQLDAAKEMLSPVPGLSGVYAVNRESLNITPKKF